MADLTALTIKAMRKMMAVEGATKQVTVADLPPIRAITSECTSLINAMRGRTDDRKRYQIGVIKSELGDEVAQAKLKPHAQVVIAGVGYTGTAEESDFIDDSGVITCYVS